MASRPETFALVSTAELSWRVLGFVNGLRLLASSSLATLFIAIMPESMGGLDPALFAGAATAYFLYALISIGSILRRSPDIVLQTWTGVFADVLVLSLLTYASGGINGGLAALVVLSIGATSFILNRQLAISIAIVATVAMLVQPAITLLADTDSMADFAAATIDAALVMIIALGVTQLARILRQNEELVRQQETTATDFSELNRSIAQHLREGVMVVDSNNTIPMISQRAAMLLQGGDVPPGSQLDDVSPKLATLLDTWRRYFCDENRSEPSMVAFDGEQRVQLKFVSLDNSTQGPALIFVDAKKAKAPPPPPVPEIVAPVASLPTQVQPSRAPVAVVSAAPPTVERPREEPPQQLSKFRQAMAARQAALEATGTQVALAPRPPTPRQLPPEEERRSSSRPPGSMLTNNDPRLRIILGNALQFGKRDSRRFERVDLAAWAKEFTTEFWTVEEIDADTLRLSVPRESVPVRADPSHLHRLVWTLCTDLLKYGRSMNAPDPVEIRIGKSTTTQRRYMDIIDRGTASGPSDAKRVFEPFLAAGRAGNGILIYVSRELSPGVRRGANNDPRPGGGVVFRLVFAESQKKVPAEEEVDQA